MALTVFQNSILRLLAANRVANGESYVAGGLALNHRLGTPRISRDIDVFHDSREALFKSWFSDKKTLEDNGYQVKTLRELQTFVEADVSRDGSHTEIQWGTDSAYRFFPLMKDEITGFTLHPIDLATNKLSALVGRTEPRDWIDVISCVQQLQPLAFLLSAACGKDPGFSPTSMLEYVARRHYNQAELDEKIIPLGVYKANELCSFWHAEVERARKMLLSLPREEAGKVVMTQDGSLFNGNDEEFKTALAAGDIVFHEGHIGGAWPRIIA